MFQEAVSSLSSSHAHTNTSSRSRREGVACKTIVDCVEGFEVEVGWGSKLDLGVRGWGRWAIVQYITRYIGGYDEMVQCIPQNTK